MQEKKEEKFWNKNTHSTDDTYSTEDILSLTKFSYSQNPKVVTKKKQICKYNHETCSSNNICYLG